MALLCRYTCLLAFLSWDIIDKNGSHCISLHSGQRKTPRSPLMAFPCPSDPFGLCSSFRVEIRALLEAQAAIWFDSFFAWSICSNHFVVAWLHHSNSMTLTTEYVCSRSPTSHQWSVLLCCLYLFFWKKWLQCDARNVFFDTPYVCSLLSDSLLCSEYLMYSDVFLW